MNEHFLLANPAAGWSNFFGACLMAYPALFSIMNPIGMALIFLQVTKGRVHQERKVLARLVATYAFMLLAFSVWVGSTVLNFFGISLDALRIAGGLVVAIGAWRLLQAPEEVEARKEEQAAQGGRTAYLSVLKDAAFFPLTMPFTVGPGTIAVAIALGAERPVSQNAVVFLSGITVGAALVSLTVLVAYAYADYLLRALGVTGARIVSRLSALILLCIGVQILAAGVQGLLIPIFHSSGKI